MKYYYKDWAAYNHDCMECEFIGSVEREDGFAIDIYRSCEEDSPFPYLIRYSSDLGDYSTVGVEQLVIHYAEFIKGV